MRGRAGRVRRAAAADEDDRAAGEGDDEHGDGGADGVPFGVSIPKVAL